MKHIKLGQSALTVGAIGYGCWRFSGSTLQDADRKIRTALDCGMTLIDTADIYGLGEPRGFGGAEEVLGDVLKTDHVDLYQIHRPDITTPMSEIARALNDMVSAGKTKHVGVSNFTVSQTRALAAHLDTPIITTQPEFSTLHQDPITDGTLDWCQETAATALAWSPLAGGRLFSEDDAVTEVLDRLAETYKSTRANVALAFTMGHGADVIPIIGTQKTERIIDSAKAAEFPLSARDFYDIIEAYRGVSMP